MHVSLRAADDLWSRRLAPVLDGSGVRSVFQPIVDLRRRTVVGYEALTRFDGDELGTPGPDVWFGVAHELGVGAELDAVAIRSALAHRQSIPTGCFLTLNIDPDHLSEPSVREALAEEGDLAGVVVEFTEHRPWDWEELAPAVRMLRGSGAGIAIDDAGAGHSGLAQLLRLRPSIVKLDRSLVQGIDRDEAKVALVETIGMFAGRLDAWVLAEGIETPAEASRLVDLRVPMAQGYLFGAPAPPWIDLDQRGMDTVSRFDDTPGETLHRLVEPAASLRRGEPVPMDWFDLDDDWLVVLDEHDRPIGVVDSTAALTGELIPALRANVNVSAAEVAQRLSTSSFDARVPVLATDNAGRHLGIITLRRLLARLADACGSN